MENLFYLAIGGQESIQQLSIQKQNLWILVDKTSLRSQPQITIVEVQRV